jgi:exodeoxyribonuclease V gamma subunit
MAPDITEYSPYIQAVFDIPKDDPRWMPFSIADQSLRYESRILEQFLAVLDLCRSRFGASQVLALLESAAIRQRCGLNEADLECIRHWVRETRIRWGQDARDRAQNEMPGFSENSWQAGMDRLLLGYAMPGYEQTLFNHILPYDRIEGAETAVLGIFSEFMNQLFKQVKGLEDSRTLEQWSQTLTGILDTFFSADENQVQEMQMVRKALLDLGGVNAAGQQPFTAAIDLKAVQWHLEQIFAQENFGRGFITGGITFGTMLPMRSIPFRVIALLGLNHDAYPRQSKPLSFDLIGRNPRPGDRSRRNDDRYLFLESILSAREVLYLSYVGQNIQDNTLMPPSVLVHELLDYAAGGFEFPGQTVREQLISRHRLQPFHADYFKADSRLFSYARENFEIARAALMERKPAPAFIESELTEAEAEFDTVDLEDLIRFFSHPARFLLNQHLGLFLDDENEVSRDEEAFELQGLEKYGLAQNLLARRLAERVMPEALTLAKAAGLLPPGVLGECLYEDLQGGIESFARRIEPLQEGAVLAPLALDFATDALRLQGRLSNIYPKGLLRYRYADIKTKDFLRIWLEHLALNSVAAEGYPHASYLFGFEERNQERAAVGYCFQPVLESTVILNRILKKYRQGLRRLLPFFPQTSYEYGRAVLEKKLDQDEALLKARLIWEEDEFRSGERQDPYYERCFGERDVLDREFQELALEIFEPLLKHREKLTAEE